MVGKHEKKKGNYRNYRKLDSVSLWQKKSKKKKKMKSKNKSNGCEPSFISSGSVSFCHT